MSHSNRSRTCAITGTGGYLGSRVKTCFEQHGWQVLELTTRPRSGAVAFRLGDNVPPKLLEGAVALIHCAYDFKPLRWLDIHAVNVVGSERLLRAARAAGVEKLVCISTISAYDGCHSLYGKAKLEIERHALANDALVLRPGLIYGDQPQGMFGKLVAQVSRASVLPLIGDGSQIQYLVHDADLCAFIHRYGEGQVAKVARPLTAAHEHGWTFRQILEAIAAAKGRRLKFFPVPWRWLWVGLKTAELCRVPASFRSDSLLSLMYPNPLPDFSSNAALGFACRPFRVEEVKL